MFEWFRHREPSPDDLAALREQMTHDDPDFAHVRDVQHDTIGVIGSVRNVRQMRDRWNADLDRAWRPDDRPS